MALPPEVLALLRQGRILAARVPARQEGWHAWVWVRPVMRCGRTFQDAVREWTRTRSAAGSHDETIDGFEVRYVELSDWHLDDQWLWDLDLAIRERPIVDEWRVIIAEAELAQLLAIWGVESESLDDPIRVDYPHPPMGKAAGSGTA
jgi:hypothetical protein